MSAVVTIVTGRISPDRVHEITDPYREALKDGPPPDLEETFLLQGDGGQLAILSVWHRREDLDAMLASGEEPFARRWSGRMAERRESRPITPSTSDPSRNRTM